MGGIFQFQPWVDCCHLCLVYYTFFWLYFFLVILSFARWRLREECARDTPLISLSIVGKRVPSAEHYRIGNMLESYMPPVVIFVDVANNDVNQLKSSKIAKSTIILTLQTTNFLEARSRTGPSKPTTRPSKPRPGSRLEAEDRMDCLLYTSDAADE